MILIWLSEPHHWYHVRAVSCMTTTYSRLIVLSPSSTLDIQVL